MTVPTFAETTFLWLPLFLVPVSGLLSVHQGFGDGNLRSLAGETLQPAGTPKPAPTPSPANFSNPGQPIWDLKMDPNNQRLTFQHWDNLTKFQCLLDGEPVGEYQVPDKKYCQYGPLPECQAKIYSVRTIRAPRLSASIMYPPPVGIQGAEAQNFRCWVHMVSLTCSWDVGHAAPRDIQYELSWEDNTKNEVHSCPNYTRDAQGVHIRCDFKDITKATMNDGRHWFRVEGKSQRGSIPCVDIFHTSPKEIEDLQAENLTFKCNGSDSKLTWVVRRSFQNSFYFEVEIKKGEEKPEITLVKDGNYLSLANEEKKFDARVRVYSLSFGYWSAWGPSRHFECKTKLGDHRLGFWLPAGLGVLCALLATVLAWVVWSRSPLQQKLFPPIPKLRDLVRDAEELPSDRLADPKQDCFEVQDEEVEIVGSP